VWQSILDALLNRPDGLYEEPRSVYKPHLLAPNLPDIPKRISDMSSNASLNRQEADEQLALQQKFDQYYRHYYNEEANKYDKVRFQSSKTLGNEYVEQAVIYDLLDLADGQQVLDVPTGTGRIAAYLAERGLHMTAVDLTENMLLEAQQRATQVGVGEQMVCVQGNACKLPFESNSFDGVISIRFFHLLPIALHRPFLLEMWRVLRPGGVLLVQFRSALTGGGLVWLHELSRRYREGRKPRYYLWPHQMRSLFDGMQNLSLHGISPAGLRLVRGSFPQVADMLENTMRDGKHTFFTHRRLFVRAVKA